jgi:hypothetical protein
VISDPDGLGAVTDKIFENTLTSFNWARQHLDRTALERAVDLLAGAAPIAFFGFGASSLVAMDAQQKFPLFDVPSRAEADAHQQIMAASPRMPLGVPAPFRPSLSLGQVGQAPSGGVSTVTFVLRARRAIVLRRL